MSEPFGALLRRHREATMVRVRRHNPTWSHDRYVTVPLSRNKLASSAGLDVAGVRHLERGLGSPRRETVLKLAGALRLDLVETDVLLVAAGFAPLLLGALEEDALREVLAPLADLARAECVSQGTAE